MRKVISAILLLMSLLLCSCGNSAVEDKESIRLSADSLEQEAETVYSHLKKIMLRNGEFISNSYFFKDGLIDGDRALYSQEGITASIQLLLAEDMDPVSLLEEQKDAVLKRLEEYSPVSENMIVEDGTSMTQISWVKERTEKKKDTVITYQYPCVYVIKMRILPDGNYFLITLEIDNENSTNQTQTLLEEFLDAYSISFR